MPSTMPGFLLLSGLLMFLASLFGGRIKFKDIELSALSTRNRIIVGTLGAAFMVTSFVFYGLDWTPDMQPPPRD